MASTTTGICRQSPSKSEPDFVTVVSVGSQPTIENFVTVLSIGTVDKDDCQAARDTPALSNPLDVHPEEQVEVFRLPGEPLGFGLKFEGGAKNAEKVKRLFVQSCAEQSPASRVKCSWGTIGEGDEVLSIDGVPVTHMSRLDCVRRLKESQLVIKLLVRCRGALRPEVVSAELKTPPDSGAKSEKIPPELPSAPPPVPPRKLRQARGFADGEANPIPARKTWNGSPKSSGSSSQTDSPQSQHSLTMGGCASNGKSTPQESLNSSPKSSHGSPSTKRSSELSKTKQEPPEAMVYLDARSQDGSSTHGSTSDDTGSSMSTVVDRFSMSDRFSTVSTTSTTSGGATEQLGTLDRSVEESSDEIRDIRETLTRPQALEHLEQDFHLNSTDYMLKRLANSEAVTHVESRGEAGGVVEKITAVVAPNTVLIEETLTIQPPLSFQDAPLSYGHEKRPDLVYTADLAADSSTHFRPISDEASIVECVNGETERTSTNRETHEISSEAPSLPARNHVNRIAVNQRNSSGSLEDTTIVVQNSPTRSCQVPMPRDSIERAGPILPPKPLPRKDIKLKRKRPPPPPPPPRREPPPPIPQRGIVEQTAKALADVTIVDITNGEITTEIRKLENNRIEKKNEIEERTMESINGNCSSMNGLTNDLVNAKDSDASILDEGRCHYGYSPSESPTKTVDYEISGKTNKVLEIIEMKKIKAFGESTPLRSSSAASQYIDESDDSSTTLSPARRSAEIVPAPREKKKLAEAKRLSTTSMEIEDSEDSTIGSSSDVWQEAKERQDSSENGTVGNHSESPDGLAAVDKIDDEKTTPVKVIDEQDDDDDDETYRSLDEIKEDFTTTENKEALSSSEEEEEETAAAAQGEGDSTSDDSEDNGDDYYWQSNLATIGEEEETSSLEYTNANKDVKDTATKSTSDKDDGKTQVRSVAIEETEVTNGAAIGDVTKLECVRRIAKEPASPLDTKLETQVNGKMENCEGDQRLPPDGDEFPATYQEFSACTSEQYQYVGTSSRNSSRNVNATSNGAGHVFKETDETSSSTTTTTTKKNAITTSTSREKLSSYVQTTNIQKPLSETRVSSQYITSSLKRETFTKQPEVTARDSCLAEDTNEKRTNASYFVSPSVIPRVKKTANNNNNEQPLVVVSEKTFEISGYYPKETKVIEVEQDYPESVPPPLPLTGPPKIDNASTVQPIKTIATDASPVRKYSLNGDLWRQDDKSERSVRDKIAMFSSQSSLEAPLFPTNATTSPASTCPSTNGRRLSKYKSSEDVFGEEKINETKEQRYNAMERTRSSVDLTDTGKVSVNDDIIVEHYAAHRAPSLPKTLPPDESTYARTSNYPIAKTPPTVYQKPNVNATTGNSVTIETREFSSSDFNNSGGKSSSAKPAVPSRNGNDSSSSIFTQKTASDKDSLTMDLPIKSPRSIPTTLTRATSFSGENKYTNDNSSLANSTSTMNNNGQISRTNSLSSTYRRNSEDMRRQSLNQLIEQRRKGISKLRGLVIPEKNAVQIDKPITDLPEIKSRDSILLHQVPKASIQDKWGSQSSLASNTSSSSLPLKATTSFKMPAPQIMSKYSPAFKRKSLAVYGSSGSSGSSVAKTPPLTARPTYNNSSSVPEPPKSLESICSPTRSDYSFEYVSSSSVSPDAMQNNPKPGQRRIRGDFDDSDNDSAVSSSQSSISRGFSPPTSPVPSERSSMSSERSYHTSLIMDMSRSYPAKETNIRPERNQYLARPGAYNDRGYPSSERSSSGSSSGSSPNPRSPQPDVNLRNSHIPQRQALKRSSSTETNCSSASSSTLTSGSQTSGESLSRRVLKPQSVEAINRKNILASARCRSGRDLNGSPLIQRKFSDDEELPVSGLAQDNGSADRSRGSNDSSNGTDRQNVKIAYIEITEGFGDDENSHTRSEVVEEIEETKITSSTEQTTNADLLEASNDLKMWVRSEAKALMADLPKSRSEDSPIKVSSSRIGDARLSPGRTGRSRSSLTLDDPSASSLLDSWNKTGSSESTTETFNYEKNSRFVSDNKETVESSSVSEDLLTTLTTKSRSRAPINLEDRSFSRSSRQMSLEDILVGKPEPKLVRTQSVTIESVSEKINSYNGSPIAKQSPTIVPRNNGRSSNNESWTEDKAFVSKIPTPGRTSKGIDSVDDSSRLDKIRVSKIPTQRTLGRRSASVTDMKKALEKPESGQSTLIGNNQIPSVTGVHQRFSSLDSSVEERTRSVGHETEADRFNEQFGSISSLASSTSLISQQELAQLVEEASSLEDARGAHDVIVVLLHKENPHGSVGITLAGGVDCEAKEITVHRVLGHSIAEKDGRVQRGDRILSINGRSTRGLNHRESLAVLKQPRSEVVLVVSRSRLEEGSRLRSRTESVETIVEGSEVCGTSDDTAWGPPTRVAIFKDGAGLGFSLAGGRDSPLGDRPLVIKKIFTGGAAEKTAALTAGDQLLEVNGIDVTRMSRIEAWSLMKKLSDGEANLLVRHPATKSS